MDSIDFYIGFHYYRIGTVQISQIANPNFIMGKAEKCGFHRLLLLISLHLD